jgi:hypothetical protein
MPDWAHQPKIPPLGSRLVGVSDALHALAERSADQIPGRGKTARMRFRDFLRCLR